VDRRGETSAAREADARTQLDARAAIGAVGRSREIQGIRARGELGDAVVAGGIGDHHPDARQRGRGGSDGRAGHRLSRRGVKHLAHELRGADLGNRRRSRQRSDQQDRKARRTGRLIAHTHRRNGPKQRLQSSLPVPLRRAAWDARGAGPSDAGCARRPRSTPPGGRFGGGPAFPYPGLPPRVEMRAGDGG